MSPGADRASALIDAFAASWHLPVAVPALSASGIDAEGSVDPNYAAVPPLRVLLCTWRI